MSKQIAVRMPEDLVHFLDEQVTEGKAANRADAVKAAVKLSRQKAAAEREIKILMANPEPDPELEAFHRWADEHPPPPLD